MLIRDSRSVYRMEIERELGKDATGKQVLDYIFGEYGEGACVDYVIYKWASDDKTVRNRLNMFWAIPLTVALSPFMYLFSGRVGWSTKSKAGRFVLRVTGHLKED